MSISVGKSGQSVASATKGGAPGSPCALAQFPRSHFEAVKLLNGIALKVELDELRRNCGYSAITDFRLPVGLGIEEFQTLNATVRDRVPLDRGSTLFHQGDYFAALYVVRTGSLKTFVEGSEGDLQILGFHLPGDIMGIGGLTNEHHPCSAEALERCSVYELRYAKLQEASASVPALHHQLIRVISGAMVNEQRHMVMMGKQLAQRRVAVFIRSLAGRYARLSRDPLSLTLSMSRGDIANYLGLALETVSRLFTRMEADGLLAVNGKSVHILRCDLLDELCGSEIDI
ncbi:MAG: cyclic nucleotide-binding domain-containing protein [Rhodanobacter sp.]